MDHCIFPLQSDWFPNPGFFLGLLHGGILNPRTNELWPRVITLVILSDQDVTRGYRAGRVWLFYEADHNERCLTGTFLMQRLHELATERHTYRDEESTINFAFGCILVELSGQLFPLTRDEHELIQEEDRQFLAQYEARKVGTTQKARHRTSANDRFARGVKERIRRNRERAILGTFP